MGSFLRGLGIGVVATALVLGGFAYMFRGVLPMILGAPTPEIPQDVAARGHDLHEGCAREDSRRSCRLRTNRISSSPRAASSRRAKIP